MPTVPFAIPICRHPKTNGLRCQSPALNGEPFCYFHVRLHKEHHRPLTAREIVDSRNLQYEGYEEAVIGGGEDPMLIARAYPNQNEFNFPPLEDAESIQLAASMLFHAIAQGQVHLRRARLLRDMLRVAKSANRRGAASPEETSVPVRHVEHTDDGLAIAPDDTPQSAPIEPQLPPHQDFASNRCGINIFAGHAAANHPELKILAFFTHDIQKGTSHSPVFSTGGIPPTRIGLRR